MLKRTLLLAIATFVVAAAGYAQGTGTSPSTASSTDSKTKHSPVFRPTKDQIKQVQTILNEKKLYAGEASGKYNDETRTGIKSFQKTAGLRETGTLNRATLEKFGVTLTESQKAIPVTESSLTPDSKSSKSTSEKSSKTTDPAKPKAPIFRATVDQIKSAQKILKDAKLYSGEETGKLDKVTREALTKYQSANGVKSTGTLNAATLEKMGVALTDKQKADAQGH